MREFDLVLKIECEDDGVWSAGYCPLDIIYPLALKLLRLALSTGCIVKTKIRDKEVCVEPDEDFNQLVNFLDNTLNSGE